VIAVGVEGEALGVGVVAGPRPRAGERIARAPGAVVAVEVEAGEVAPRIGLGDRLAVQRVGEGGVGLLQRRPHTPPLLQHLARGLKKAKASRQANSPNRRPLPADRQTKLIYLLQTKGHPKM
jgi:hypothetical protein